MVRHRSVGGIRASTYNACTMESVEALVSFMKDFEAIIKEFSPLNSSLLTERDNLQSKIDEWHRERRGEKVGWVGRERSAPFRARWSELWARRVG